MDFETKNAIYSYTENINEKKPVYIISLNLNWTEFLFPLIWRFSKAFENLQIRGNKNSVQFRFKEIIYTGFFSFIFSV